MTTTNEELPPGYCWIGGPRMPNKLTARKLRKAVWTRTSKNTCHWRCMECHGWHVGLEDRMNAMEDPEVAEAVRDVVNTLLGESDVSD